MHFVRPLLFSTTALGIYATASESTLPNISQDLSPVGPCVNGHCPTGYECINDKCHPIK